MHIGLRSQSALEREKDWGLRGGSWKNDGYDSSCWTWNLERSMGWASNNDCSRKSELELDWNMSLDGPDAGELECESEFEPEPDWTPEG